MRTGERRRWDLLEARAATLLPFTPVAERRRVLDALRAEVPGGGPQARAMLEAVALQMRFGLGRSTGSDPEERAGRLLRVTRLAYRVGPHLAGLLRTAGGVDGVGPEPRIVLYLAGLACVRMEGRRPEETERLAALHEALAWVRQEEMGWRFGSTTERQRTRELVLHLLFDATGPAVFDVDGPTAEELHHLAATGNVLAVRDYDRPWTQRRLGYLLEALDLLGALPSNTTAGNAARLLQAAGEADRPIRGRLIDVLAALRETVRQL